MDRRITTKSRNYIYHTGTYIRTYTRTFKTVGADWGFRKGDGEASVHRTASLLTDPNHAGQSKAFVLNLYCLMPDSKKASKQNC